MNDKIRILIADDHKTLSARLRQALDAQQDMEVVEEIRQGDRVVAEVLDREPDVLLINLGIAGGGLRTLEEVAQRAPRTRTVVLALNDEISLLRSVLAVAQLGYVVHRGSHAEMLSVIRKVHLGRGYVEVPTGGLHMDPGLDPTSDSYRRLNERLEQLSKREREVLRAVAYGYTNREIAERIGISIKSVETYRYRLSEKLGFKSRADLVRFALEVGLLQTGREGLPRQMT